MKKIVVLTGSPRKSGNSFALTDAFIESARKQGHEVVRFDAAFKNVGGCRDCKTCFTTGKACTHDDDFNAIAADLLDADAIVFSTPVYWYSFPAQIKAVIDKMFSFVVGQKNFSGKDFAIISCCEENDLTVMEGVCGPLKRAAGLLKWNLVGEVLVPGVFAAGDIDNTDGCAWAAALAEKF